MTKNFAYIELGGNQGDRHKLIKSAKLMIASNQCSIVSESSIYETPPWGFKTPQNFYNQVIKIETNKPADQLIQTLHTIEKKLGRIRTSSQYSSRTMDLDILFYNEEIITLDNLVIPHERLHMRNFVLIPLCEIAPNFIHPVLHKTITALLSQCSDQSVCKKIEL